jgi:polyisoprenoid-binding protein YceI
MAWKVDSNRSKVEFEVRHLRITTVRGHFGSFSGTLAMDETKPEAASVLGSVDVASLTTGFSIRDANVRAGGFIGFFDAKRYPKISFTSTRVGPFEGANFKVYGDMTIKNVTRPVVFDVVNKGELPASQGKRRWSFSASINLSRDDFNLHFNPIMDLGRLLVADDVKGSMEIEFVEE